MYVKGFYSFPTLFEQTQKERDAYRNALENILEVCNGYVGAGPLKTIVDIANDVLDKKE